MSTQDVQGYLEPGATGPVDTAPTALATPARRSYATAPGYRVNIRKGPGTGFPIVGRLESGAHVEIRCQRHGERVSGPYGTSDIWDNIAPGQYVSDTYVHTGSDGFVAAPCGG
ncbi:peptidase [Streptomyces sp. NPDC048248]|uniref:peptidase n=1 Tax=Streptomyces sp. NPDC048248 TaxID=3365523 RepID=UPI003712D956